MRVRWFGSPWPSAERPAPVCEDVAHKIPVPVGTKCLECTKPIGERDRGVVTSCSTAIWGHWMLNVEGAELPVCSYHLKCFLEVTVGGEFGASIIERMREREPEMTAGREDVDVEPGRGWRSG